MGYLVGQLAGKHSQFHYVAKEYVFSRVQWEDVRKFMSDIMFCYNNLFYVLI